MQEAREQVGSLNWKESFPAKKEQRDRTASSNFASQTKRLSSFKKTKRLSLIYFVTYMLFKVHHFPSL